MRQLALWAAAGAALASLLLSERFIGALHMLLAERGREALPPPGHVADVAVVLGYALFRNGSMTAPLLSRVQVGLHAYTSGAARRLLFSGSHPTQARAERTEAAMMRAYAQQLMDGEPPSGAWYEEGASTSTYENAKFSLGIALQNGWSSVLLVTNPFHQWRAYRTFRRALEDLAQQQQGQAGGAPLNVQVHVAPAPYAPHRGYGLPLFDRVVDWIDWGRELAAIAYYHAYKGYI